MNQIQSISHAIKDKVTQHILRTSNQVISFSEFMNIVLYEPQLGFYSNSLQKFGRQGHFVTAPTLGKLFAESLAKQISEIFTFGLRERNFLEIGAGEGTLASNILRVIGNQIDCYYILELNATLVAHQKAIILELVPEYFDKVQWLSTLPEKFVGVIVANEVLDALPFNRVKVDNDGQDIIGLGVGVSENNFVEKEYALDQVTLSKLQALNLSYNNYVTEVNVLTAGFVQSIAGVLDEGAIIFIDYGFGQKDYYAPNKIKGNCRGFFAHQVYNNFFEHLGLMDITTDVNFTDVASSGIKADLDLIGYTNQGAFLININPNINDIAFSGVNIQHVKHLHEVQTLVSPMGMGAIFKVIGFSKGLSQDEWLGFKTHDLTHQL
jgi:SAM-dependent MidA family methyltransferase